MKIYVVMGTVGEYSEREVWVVAACHSRDKAEELIINCDAESRRIYLLANEKGKNRPTYNYNTLWSDKDYDKERDIAAKAWWLDYDTDKAMRSKYDKKYKDIGMYNQASYSYEEVDLIG